MEKYKVECYGDGCGNSYETYAIDSFDAIDKIMARHPGYDEYYCGGHLKRRSPKIITRDKITFNRKKLQKKPLPVKVEPLDIDFAFL